MNLEQLSVDEGNGKSINIRLAADELPRGKRSKRIILVAAVVVGSVGVVSVLGFFIWWRKRRWVGNWGRSSNYRLKAISEDLNIQNSMTFFKTEGHNPMTFHKAEGHNPMTFLKAKSHNLMTFSLEEDPHIMTFRYQSFRIGLYIVNKRHNPII